MIIIRNARIVNEGRIFEGDVLIKNGRIEKVGGTIEVAGKAREIDAQGCYLLPGAIDDQVHRVVIFSRVRLMIRCTFVSRA